MFSQILASIFPFEILLADIRDPVVEVLVPQVRVARRRLHLERAILNRRKGSAKSATTHVVDRHVAGRSLLGTCEEALFSHSAKQWAGFLPVRSEGCAGGGVDGNEGIGSGTPSKLRRNM